MLKKCLRRNIIPGVCGVLLGIVSSGCRMSGLDRDIICHELDSQRMVERLRSGETTRAEEQEFIVADFAAWQQVRAGRKLVNPTVEGPLAADFQLLLGNPSTEISRISAWYWMFLSVLNPHIDLRRASVE